MKHIHFFDMNPCAIAWGKMLIELIKAGTSDDLHGSQSQGAIPVILGIDMDVQTIHGLIITSQGCSWDSECSGHISGLPLAAALHLTALRERRVDI